MWFVGQDELRLDSQGKKSKSRDGRKSIIQVVSSIFHKKSPTSLSPPKSAPASSSSHSKFGKFKLSRNKDKSKVWVLRMSIVYSLIQTVPLQAQPIFSESKGRLEKGILNGWNVHLKNFASLLPLGLKEHQLIVSTWQQFSLPTNPRTCTGNKKLRYADILINKPYSPYIFIYIIK